MAKLYARYLCSRDALGLKARPSARATIGYLVYKWQKRYVLQKGVQYINFKCKGVHNAGSIAFSNDFCVMVLQP